jgi:hypothetical protein
VITQPQKQRLPGKTYTVVLSRVVSYLLLLLLRLLPPAGS